VLLVTAVEWYASVARTEEEEEEGVGLWAALLLVELSVWLSLPLHLLAKLTTGI
jgi:hypothetical protein